MSAVQRTLAQNGATSRPSNSTSPFHASLYHSHHFRQSSNLPRRLYVALCVIFQVDVGPGDKCVIGKLIFTFTILVSAGYGVIGAIFTVFDIKSGNTKQTVTTGLFNMFMNLLWIALGVYANRLGRRILKSTTFVGSLRMHSKTVFKIPATLLVFALALCSITIEAYRSYLFFWDETACNNVSLDGSICKLLFIFKVLQTIVVLIFNICVAAAVFSICRTHTIGVRRFIKSLERDGQACESKHRERFMKLQLSASNSLNELYLPEECYGDDSDSDSIDGDKHSLITYVPDRESSAAANPSAANTSINSSELRQTTSNGAILSKDDILFSYWKLASRMRMTSRVLQRWTSSWITFTILWLVHFIIVWLNHPSTYLEIGQFILPLLMTIILCTAYGEANGEADKIIMCITPLQDRLEMIRTLPSILVGMTLYNHPVAYGNILTVVAAVGLALSSRMILDEFLPPSPHS